MLRYLPFVAILAFTIYCVFDVLGSDALRRRGLPSVVWLLIVVLLPVLGGVVWMIARRSAPKAGGARPRRSGPVAPDDDPEFLFRLEQEQRRREQPGAPTSDGPTQDRPAQDGPTQDGPTQDEPTQDEPTQDGRPGGRGTAGNPDGTPSP